MRLRQIQLNPESISREEAGAAEIPDIENFYRALRNSAEVVSFFTQLSVLDK